MLINDALHYSLTLFLSSVFTPFVRPSVSPPPNNTIALLLFPLPLSFISYLSDGYEWTEEMIGIGLRTIILYSSDINLST